MNELGTNWDRWSMIKNWKGRPWKLIDNKGWENNFYSLRISSRIIDNEPMKQVRLLKCGIIKIVIDLCEFASAFPKWFRIWWEKCVVNGKTRFAYWFWFAYWFCSHIDIVHHMSSWIWVWMSNFRIWLLGIRMRSFLIHGSHSWFTNVHSWFTNVRRIKMLSISLLVNWGRRKQIVSNLAPYIFTKWQN